MESIRGISPWATIGFAVARQMGARWNIDYTITGHAGPRGTPEGARVYQPVAAPGYEAGTVADSPTPGGAHADVARVAFYDHNIDPKIHVGHGRKRDVVSYVDPYLGQSVLKSGARTGATPGHIVCTNYVFDNPVFGLMPNHVRATYHSRPGDSGAPVYEGLGYPCYGAVILFQSIAKELRWPDDANLLPSPSLYIIEGQILVRREVRASDDKVNEAR